MTDIIIMVKTIDGVKKTVIDEGSVSLKYKIFPNFGKEKINSRKMDIENKWQIQGKEI